MSWCWSFTHTRTHTPVHEAVHAFESLDPHHALEGLCSCKSARFDTAICGLKCLLELEEGGCAEGFKESARVDLDLHDAL
jgi:hypothetical protein